MERRGVTPARWFRWTVLAAVVLLAALAVGMLVNPSLSDLLDVMVRDPQKNWVGLVLMILGAGWVLARATQ